MRKAILAAAAVLCAASLMSAPQTARAAAPAPCSGVTVATDDEIAAAKAKSGDPFRYTTTGSKDVRVATGLHGTGQIVEASPAKKKSKPAEGRLSFGTVTSANGPVALQSPSAGGTVYVAGKKDSIPAAYTIVPGIGTAMRVHNRRQTGSDLVLPAGTTFCLNAV
jgi:hypothetical protein